MVTNLGSMAPAIRIINCPVWTVFPLQKTRKPLKLKPSAARPPKIGMFLPAASEKGRLREIYA